MSAKHSKASWLQAIDSTDLAERASRPLSAVPRAFLRWAGSKRQTLSHILSVLPEHHGTYYEPFLGSGALFFLLQPPRAVLSDTCLELIATFRALRDDVEAIIRHLTPLRPRKRLYYRIRNNRSTERFQRAAEFLFLNKACWNGLYRVNSLGQFNVPYGLPKTDFIADFENLRACSRALRRRGIRLRRSDFEDSLDDARAGDLVYLDPPYVTRHSNNGFVDYNEVLFSWKDQQRLARVARRLAAKGVRIVLTNANHREVLDLYPGFASREFQRSSTLASDATKRGSVRELILYSPR